MARISLVCTVLNEAGVIKRFFDSINAQTRKPDEFIIVDGGSVDGTVQIARQYNPEFPVTVIIQHGAKIAQGRNIGIEKATGEIIAVTDAGCYPEPGWLEKIIAPIENDGVDVGAGWYEAAAETDFEKCVAGHTIPTLETVNPGTYLPASRSIAFKKSAWKTVGGYPEKVSSADDTIFDVRLKNAGFKFMFIPEARVKWHVRKTWKGVWSQYFSYSRGDAEGRTNTCDYVYLLGRLAIGAGLIITAAITNIVWLWGILLGLVLGYGALRIIEGCRFAKFKGALIMLPLAIMIDTSRTIGYLCGGMGLCPKESGEKSK